MKRIILSAMSIALLGSGCFINAMKASTIIEQGKKTGTPVAFVLSDFKEACQSKNQARAEELYKKLLSLHLNPAKETILKDGVTNYEDILTGKAPKQTINQFWNEAFPKTAFPTANPSLLRRFGRASLIASPIIAAGATYAFVPAVRRSVNANLVKACVFAAPAFIKAGSAIKTGTFACGKFIARGACALAGWMVRKNK